MLLISAIATFLLATTKAQEVFDASKFFPNTTLTNCGNGVCDYGENCLSCGVDCVSGTSGGFECGNGVCEDGETCFTCPKDCMSKEPVGGDLGFCCYGGKTHPGITNAVSCDYFQCNTGQVKCDKEESPFVTYCCGDGVCSGNETSLNCEIDNCVKLCGNHVCDVDEGENADNCAGDCECNLDGICDPWETVNSCSLDCTCGDRVCNYDLGENVSNCMTDCACNANYKCEAWEDPKHCPRDCGDTAAYGNGEGHDADNGYDGMDQQLDGSSGYDYVSSGIGGHDSMGMNGEGLGDMGGMMDSGETGNGSCTANDKKCTDNNDCCSSACDANKCVG